MNDELKRIFESYEKEKAKIRRKLDANKKELEKLNKELNEEIDKVYSGCATFRDRVNARDFNKSIINALGEKIARAQETGNILSTALKVANEMIVYNTVNALRTELIANPEKWCKYPLHFQKFKDLIKSFLDGTGLSLYNSGYGSYYISGCYDFNDIHGYIFDTRTGIITDETIQEMKRKQEHPIIKASDILTECKKAFDARKKIIAKYEKVKSEIDALRNPIASCGALYNILPYAPLSMENYKRF